MLGISAYHFNDECTHAFHSFAQSALRLTIWESHPPQRALGPDSAILRSSVLGVRKWLRSRLFPDWYAIGSQRQC